MNKFPYCHVFDGQVVRAAAPGIGETWDRILFASLYNQKYFPLHGEDKFPLWEGYIFEIKIPLVVQIGLAAHACGSRIGPSPSNSVRYAIFPGFSCCLCRLCISCTGKLYKLRRREGKCWQENHLKTSKHEWQHTYYWVLKEMYRENWLCVVWNSFFPLHQLVNNNRVFWIKYCF